jgi:hypothetical protein
MGAFVSLAFAWTGSFEDFSALDAALSDSGLRAIDEGQVEDGTREKRWALTVGKDVLMATSRSYERDGWVSTLDVPEEAFEEAARQLGRQRVIEIFVDLASELLRRLGLPYVFFEEEAEAETAPEQYTPEELFGITLVADKVPLLEEARQNPDLKRVEEFPGGVVLYKRLDPIPHYDGGPSPPEGTDSPADSRP